MSQYITDRSIFPFADVHSYRYRVNEASHPDELQLELQLQDEPVAMERRRRDVSVTPKETNQTSVSYVAMSPTKESTAAPANVSYSTDNATATATVTPVKVPSQPSEAVSTTARPAANGKKVIVSTPIVPAKANGSGEAQAAPASDADKPVSIGDFWSRWVRFVILFRLAD